jgi:hypothetical protein
MLPFGVTIPATVPQRSEIPEGLMNYPVYDTEKMENNKEWTRTTEMLDTDNRSA